MDLGLAGRVYVVTGGTQGLGFAAAQALVAEDARVVVSSRSSSNVTAAIATLGANAAGIAGANADPSLPDRLVAEAHARFGRLDGLLVSVGGPPTGTIEGTDPSVWQAAFESIFLGTLAVVRRVARELSEGGAIALVLSTSVREPLPNLAVSNGLRPGLAMIAKTLAGEVGPRGIRVVSLLPGAFRTGRNAALFQDPAAEEARTAGIPLRRIGEPAEFGRAAAFVLSPAASYIHGTTISIDGGSIHGL
jgi:3-oxoacyl-[acyl-carrier protein] reductase